MLLLAPTFSVGEEKVGARRNGFRGAIAIAIEHLCATTPSVALVGVKTEGLGAARPKRQPETSAAHRVLQSVAPNVVSRLVNQRIRLSQPAHQA